MRANTASLTNINKLQANLRQGRCRYSNIVIYNETLSRLYRYYSVCKP